MNRLLAYALFASLSLLVGCSSSPSTQQKSQPPAAAAAKTSTAPAVAAPRSTPKSTPASTSANAAPVAASTPADTTATTPKPVGGKPKLTPEAEAVIYRLTHAVGGNTEHELADTTGFPSALVSLEEGVAAPKVENLGNVSLPPPRGLTADGNSTELVVRDWTGLVLVPVNTALAKAYTTEVRLLKVEAHPLHDGRLRIWARVRNVSGRTLPAEIACSFRMRGETTPNSPYFYQLEVPSGAYRDVFFVSPDGELSAYTVLVRSEEMWKQK
jgi:hypothetical protein